MIIKFYDNERCEYPLLDIWGEDFEKLKKILENYQKEEEYNWDDFLVLLGKNDIAYSELNFVEELFF